MLHSGSRFLARLIGVVALAACVLAQAQQPSGQAQSEGSTRQEAGPAPYTGDGPGGGARIEPGRNLMASPYRMIENWPTLNPGMKWGAAINFRPDNKGGTWVLLRTEPPINYFDASGKIVKSIGQGVFVQAHGMCRDRDGNLWTGDSGTFC